MLDMSPKGQLLSGIIPQASTEEEAAAFRSFIDALSDDQAQQLLDLDGFTEEIKIPIWSDETSGPIRDATKKREKNPDTYLEGITEPRRIADDLSVILLVAAFDTNKLIDLVSGYARLDSLNKKYWQLLNEVLSRIFLELPSVGGKRISDFVMPTDLIINQRIWTQDKPGNMKLAINSTVKKGLQVKTYFTMNFDSLPKEIQAKLDSFDEEVYLAAANLWLAGNEYISASMIYSVHNNGRPSPEAIEKMKRNGGVVVYLKIPYEEVV
jgi:hypothetical protein